MFTPIITPGAVEFMIAAVWLAWGAIGLPCAVVAVLVLAWCPRWVWACAAVGVAAAVWGGAWA